MIDAYRPRHGLVTAGTFSFGDFELDLAANELRCGNGAIRLQRIPMELLALLVARAGDVVTRGEIVERLWGKDAFIDVEASINTAMRKLRRALQDDVDHPSYVLTIPAKGYRFIAQVTYSDAAAAGGSARDSSPIVLAVLPFEYVNADPEDEYFADGLTEETIAALGRVSPEHLVVIARRSTIAYKGTAKGVEEIGSELGVDYLVDGSIRREARRIRVNAKLIRVRGQSQIWSASYDREAGSFLGLQDELGVAIAERVRLRLSPERAAGLAGGGTRNAEAYDLYLRGRFCMFQVTPAASRKAAEYFERAAQLDPGYALAYAGLADVYVNLPVNSDADPKPCWRKAREAAERAVALDDQLAEAHTSLGLQKFWLGWDWPGAEQCFRRALELEPNFAWAELTLAVVLSGAGRHDESAAAMSRCLALDPVSPLAHAVAGQHLFQARANSAALERLRYALAIDGEFWISHIVMGKVYEQLGRPAAALDACQQALAYSGGNTEALSLKGYVLATTGRGAEAEDVMAALERIAVDKFVPPYNIALVAAGLGDARLAFEWLEKAYEARDVHMVFLPVDPKWDAYRRDERFRSLLRRCGLPAATPG